MDDAADGVPVSAEQPDVAAAPHFPHRSAPPGVQDGVAFTPTSRSKASSNCGVLATVAVTGGQRIRHSAEALLVRETNAYTAIHRHKGRIKPFFAFLVARRRLVDERGPHAAHSVTR